MIGGDVPKNFAQDTVVAAELLGFETIATAKVVKTPNARHLQWHLVNNRIDRVFYGFDSLSKTSIAQFYLSLVNREASIEVYTLHPESVAKSARRVWNVALSITTICPGSSMGSKQVSNQASNTIRLHAPTKVKGAIKLVESMWGIIPSTSVLDPDVP